MAERSLRFDLLARDKTFSKTLDAAGRKGQRLHREFDRTLGQAGDSGGRRFSTRFSQRLGGGFSVATKLATRAAVGIAGAFAAVKVVGFLKDAITEAREAAKVGRQTNAVIKATGGVANVTAKDVGRLSTALMRHLGVDDDVIASGQNIILTFKGVRNETGKNNRIFDQATVASLDMTAAMNKGVITQEGLQASSIRVGRALNDPIKGMTALTRVGVTFTQKQRDQITALVEAGDTMAAQKIILGELKSEFGGAARAAADPWQRVGVVLGELKEQIGTALLPVLSKAADWLSVNLPKAFDALQEKLRVARDWWLKNKDAVEILAGVLTTIFTPAVEDAKTGTDDLRTSNEQLSDSLDAILEVVLRATQGYIQLARFVGNVSLWILDLISFAGQAVNVFDKLSGGTGRAGQKMVDWARDMKTQTRVQLGKLSEDARDTQRAIDKLHGKNINITARPAFQFSKSFTQVDWLSARQAAGRMAEGGKIRQGTGPTADDVMAWVSKGETVVPAADSRDPGFQQWAAAKGIPGFARGGTPLPTRIGQTGVAHTGAANLMGGYAKRTIDRALAKLLAGNPAVRAFIRSVDRLPYRWGAAGPSAYDCSGLVSAVLGKHTGAGGGRGQRYFTTSTIRPGILGLRPGLGGILQIGVTPGSGHMAGRYGGLGFEAESTRTGIKIGGAASPPEGFARRFHLAKGGKVTERLLARLGARGLDVGGDPGRIRINGKTFDAGGYLPPHSATLAINRTGRPEPVGAAVGDVHVHFHGPILGDAARVANELAPKIRAAVRDVQRRSGVAPARQLA